MEETVAGRTPFGGLERSRRPGHAPLPSGLYVYRLVAGGQTLARTMTLAK